jgi:hypothetical protein
VTIAQRSPMLPRRHRVFWPDTTVSSDLLIVYLWLGAAFVMTGLLLATGFNAEILQILMVIA